MFKGKSINLYFLAVCISIPVVNLAYAEPIYKDAAITTYSPHKVDVYFSGGPVFSKLRNNTALSIDNSVVNDYNTSRHTNWTSLFGVGIGHTFVNIFHVPLSLSLGVAGYALNATPVNGIEYPFINDDLYDTLNYQFSANSSAVMVETRWIYTDYAWQPFALVGIGAAWNRLSNYSEVPSNPSLSAAPVLSEFGSHTNSAFAYEFGVGVQHLMYEDLAHNISYTGAVEYRYLDFGKGRLSPFPAETSGQGLQVNNINTQGVMFTLKASFC